MICFSYLSLIGKCNSLKIFARRCRDGIWTAVIICGSVTTTVFAPHEGAAETDDEIFQKYLSSKFAW